MNVKLFGFILFVFLMLGCGEAVQKDSEPLDPSISAELSEAQMTNQAESVLGVDGVREVVRDEPPTNQGLDPEKQGWWSGFVEKMKSGSLIASKGLLLVLIFLLCMVAILFSVLSFSGTWVVLVSGIISFFVLRVPSIGTLLFFLLLCLIVEVFEAVAGFYGVKKRGGSKWAGFASLVGAMLGAMAGSVLIPIIGTVIGLLLGSFLGVFLVEWFRLQNHGDASHIAWGAFFARLGIIFLKLTVTFLMSVWVLFCVWQGVF